MAYDAETAQDQPEEGKVPLRDRFIQLIVDDKELGEHCHSEGMKALKNHGIEELPEDDMTMEHSLYWATYAMAQMRFMMGVVHELAPHPEVDPE